MPDLTLAHKVALAGVETGIFGTPAPSGPGVILRALPEGHLLHVLAAPGCKDIAPLLEKLAGNESAVRFAGPGQWFITGDALLPAAQADAYATQLGHKAALSDQSHGRVRIALSGPHTADLLAKGTAIDLHPDAFAPGQSAMALIGHIAVNLARTGPDRFELIVLRSFARNLWEDLVHMGLEYGIECTAP